MEPFLVAGAIILVAVVVGIAVLGWQLGNLRGKYRMMEQSRQSDPFSQVGLAGVTPHTHTYTIASQHEEGGRKVIVRKCEQCPSVVRDKE